MVTESIRVKWDRMGPVEPLVGRLVGFCPAGSAENMKPVAIIIEDGTGKFVYAPVKFVEEIRDAST